MIENEMIDATVNIYDTQLDSYGQRKKTISSSYVIKIMVKPYSNQIVNNPKYNEAEFIALTKDRMVNSSNTITFNNKTYDVLYVIPSYRYNQLFLLEVK